MEARQETHRLHGLVRNLLDLTRLESGPRLKLSECDVSDLVGAKRAAMVAHASQIAADSWFLAMDDEQFTRAFGTEWFIRTGGTRAEGVPFLESIWA